MKFEEFKNLLKERKRISGEIQSNITTYKSVSYPYLEDIIESLRKEFNAIDDKLLSISTKEHEETDNKVVNISDRLEKKLRVKFSNFLKPVREYFKSKGIIADLEFEDYPAQIYLVLKGANKNNAYKLNINYTNGIVLDVLYTENGSNSLKVLLRDYPELEEVLWQCVEQEMKDVVEEKTTTIIQRMIKKKEEIDFYSDEKNIEKIISDLEESKAKDKQELLDVWANADKVEI